MWPLGLTAEHLGRGGGADGGPDDRPSVAGDKLPRSGEWGPAALPRPSDHPSFRPSTLPGVDDRGFNISVFGFYGLWTLASASADCD